MPKRTTTEEPQRDFAGAINDEALARHVDEIERLQDSRAKINAAITAAYKNSRSAGFNARLLRRIVAERRLDEDTRREQYETLDRYRRSLGMLADLPLGEAAMRAAGADDPIFAAPGRPKAAADNTREFPRKTFAEQALPKRPRGRPRKIRAPNGGTEHPDLTPAA